MTTQRIGEEGLRWFIGSVEDNLSDPKQLGRVRVRVFNEHDDPSITTDQLPWATPIMPPMYASHKQVGRSPTGIAVGSIVFGFYLDGQEKQFPMIWGTYSKLPDGTPASNDIPQLALGTNTIKQTLIGPEPKSPYGSKYPFNNVWQTSSGHVFEVDDTAGAERIRNYHTSGTYEEIGPDGTTVQKIVGDDYSIVVKDKTAYIQGKMNIVVIGDANISVDGTTNITCPTTNIYGNVNINGKLTASVDVVGGGISLKSHIHSDPQGGTTGEPQ